MHYPDHVYRFSFNRIILFNHWRISIQLFYWSLKELLLLQSVIDSLTIQKSYLPMVTAGDFSVSITNYIVPHRILFDKFFCVAYVID